VIRKLLMLALLGALAVTGLVVPPSPRPTSAAETAGSLPIDVLFVGNSLIGTKASSGEDTPDVVRHLARDTGRRIRVVKVIRFGSTLQRTWDLGLVKGVLNGSSRYDYIVLQEYSTLVATQPAKVEKTLVQTYAPVLVRSLKPGGRVVLFKNWALVNPAPFASRARNVAAIDTGYTRLKAILPVPSVIAPISDEFEAVVARDGTRPLIVKDGKHPTSQAIYMDAATLYGIFFGRTPRNLPRLYLARSTAGRLCGVAATALGY
jgi:hypothetical protein